MKDFENANISNISLGGMEKMEEKDIEEVVGGNYGDEKQDTSPYKPWYSQGQHVEVYLGKLVHVKTHGATIVDCIKNYAGPQGHNQYFVKFDDPKLNEEYGNRLFSAKAFER